VPSSSTFQTKLSRINQIIDSTVRLWGFCSHRRSLAACLLGDPFFPPLALSSALPAGQMLLTFPSGHVFVRLGDAELLGCVHGGSYRQPPIVCSGCAGQWAFKVDVGCPTTSFGTRVSLVYDRFPQRHRSERASLGVGTRMGRVRRIYPSRNLVRMVASVAHLVRRGSRNARTERTCVGEREVFTSHCKRIDHTGYFPSRMRYNMPAEVVFYLSASVITKCLNSPNVLACLFDVVAQLVHTRIPVQ
jgi:hypothetical protein